MRRTILALALALAAGACSSPAAETTPRGGAADASAPPASADAEADQGPPKRPPCSEPLEERAPGATCVLEATGKVTDLAGAPLGNLVVTFCGSTCFGTRSDAAGSFAIPIGAFVNRESYAIHVDGRPDHAATYLRLANGPEQVIAVAAPFLLPALPAGGPLLPPDEAAGSRVTSGDLTLAVADGTSFDLEIADFGNGDAGRTLRVAPVPLDKAPEFARLAKSEAIYALAPSGATASKKMAVTLRNALALPAGVAVELLVLGTDYLSAPPTVGLLSVAAAAHVAADGKTITTDPGEGITKLSWLGIRRKGN